MLLYICVGVGVGVGVQGSECVSAAYIELKALRNRLASDYVVRRRRVHARAHTHTRTHAHALSLQGDAEDTRGEAASPPPPPQVRTVYVCPVDSPLECSHLSC